MSFESRQKIKKIPLKTLSVNHVIKQNNNANSKLESKGYKQIQAAF